MTTAQRPCILAWPIHVRLGFRRRPFRQKGWRVWTERRYEPTTADT